MWLVDGPSHVPRARIVDCDRARSRPKPATPSLSRTRVPGHVCAGQQGHYIVGWGWAGRCNQAVPPNPPKTRSSKHPRQHKPFVATRAKQRHPRPVTGTRPHKPGTRFRKLLRRFCPSSRSSCCTLPSGRCTGGYSPIADIRRGAALGIRARRRGGARGRRRLEAGGWSRRWRAVRGAFRRTGPARGALRSNALGAKWPSMRGADWGSPPGRSRRRSTARMLARFFGLV